MSGGFLNPQNAVAFRRIFGTDKNKDILLDMLNNALKSQFESPIKEIEFLSPVQDPELAAIKQSIVDVLCKDEEGNQYIVQLQVAQSAGFQERAQHYATKVFLSQMKEGGKYENVKRVIFLAFCNFDVFPEKKAYKHVIPATPNKASEGA